MFKFINLALDRYALGLKMSVPTYFTTQNDICLAQNNDKDEPSS